jgi:hypothetical protein
MRRPDTGSLGAVRGALQAVGVMAVLLAPLVSVGASQPEGMRDRQTENDPTAPVLDWCLSTLPVLPWATPATDAFDRRFDQSGSNNSFACQGFVRASAMRRALDRFRAAVLYEDEAALREAVYFPVRVRRSPEDPRIRLVKTPAEWWAFQRRYLTAAHRAIIACANLHSLVVDYGTGGYGMYMARGRFWWLVWADNPDVRLHSVWLNDHLDAAFVADVCTHAVRDPQGRTPRP